MKNIKKIVSLILAICLMLSVATVAVFAEGTDLTGKTVILYTGNLRGDIDKLPQIAQVKKDYEARNATVILVDTGNFLQGTVFSSWDSGEKIVPMMKASGYEAIALGNYDFAFSALYAPNGMIGTPYHANKEVHPALTTLLTDNSITGLSANIYNGEELKFTSNSKISGVTLFGLTATDTAKITNRVYGSDASALTYKDPSVVAGKFATPSDDTDLVIGLSNAGSVTKPAGVDYIIDIPETGNFTIGALIISGTTITTENVTLQTATEAVSNVTALVNACKTQFPIGTYVAESSIDMDGSEAEIKSGNSALGNLVTDALLWAVQSGKFSDYCTEADKEAGKDTLKVPSENVIATWNAGNIRAYLHKGDVCEKDLLRVLPFPNKISIAYVTGAELLEYLESTSQGAPFTIETSGLCNSLLSVSGIDYTIDTYKTYDNGEKVADSDWYKAKTLSRVTINSVNGKEFSKTSTYAIVTHDKSMGGMDGNYLLGGIADANKVNTSYDGYKAVMDYIKSELDGKIGSEYASAKVRTHYASSAESKTVSAATFVENSDGTATITCNESFKYFKGIKMDGKEVDAKNYTAKEGSTIVTFTNDYLKTLSVDKHIVSFLYDYNDGNGVQEIKGTLTVAAKDATTGTTTKPADKIANTADTTRIASATLLVLVSGVGMIALPKLRKENY